MVQLAELRAQRDLLPPDEFEQLCDDFESPDPLLQWAVRSLRLPDDEMIAKIRTFYDAFRGAGGQQVDVYSAARGRRGAVDLQMWRGVLQEDPVKLIWEPAAETDLPSFMDMRLIVRQPSGRVGHLSSYARRVQFGSTPLYLEGELTGSRSELEGDLSPDADSWIDIPARLFRPNRDRVLQIDLPGYHGPWHG